jgi:hypothetical protein
MGMGLPDLHTPPRELVEQLYDTPPLTANASSWYGHPMRFTTLRGYTQTRLETAAKAHAVATFHHSTAMVYSIGLPWFDFQPCRSLCHRSYCQDSEAYLSLTPSSRCCVMQSGGTCPRLIRLLALERTGGRLNTTSYRPAAKVLATSKVASRFKSLQVSQVYSSELILELQPPNFHLL